MHIGVVFPQIEFGNDTGALKEYIQTVEGLGYTHLLAYDHVLSADTTNRPDFSGPYTLKDPFHEVFVFFGYVAALTKRLELVTGHSHPAATADRAGGQASGGSRCIEQWAFPAGNRRGVERGRVRRIG